MNHKFWFWFWFCFYVTINWLKENTFVLGLVALFVLLVALYAYVTVESVGMPVYRGECVP